MLISILIEFSISSVRTKNPENQLAPNRQWKWQRKWSQSQIYQRTELTTIQSNFGSKMNFRKKDKLTQCFLGGLIMTSADGTALGQHNLCCISHCRFLQRVKETVVWYEQLWKFWYLMKAWNLEFIFDDSFTSRTF